MGVSIVIDEIGQSQDPNRWTLTDPQIGTVRASVRASVAKVLSATLHSGVDFRIRVLREMTPEQRKLEYVRIIDSGTWGVIGKLEVDVPALCKSVLFRAAKKMEAVHPPRELVRKVVSGGN